jgi:hypothetical protein
MVFSQVVFEFCCVIIITDAPLLQVKEDVKIIWTQVEMNSAN